MSAAEPPKFVNTNVIIDLPPKNNLIPSSSDVLVIFFHRYMLLCFNFETVAEVYFLTCVWGQCELPDVALV